MKSNSSRNLSFVLMGVGLLLVAFGIYGLLRPAEFQARARIRLEEPNDSSSGSPRMILVCFGPTEIETIQSDTILSNTVFRLNLDSKSGQKPLTPRSVAILRSQLDVRPHPNTTLIDIRAANEDAMEAARIANTLAEVYSDWKLENGRRLVEGGIAELVKQLKLQAQRTQKAEDNIEGLRKALAIPSPEPSDDFLTTNFPAYVEAKRNLDETKDIERLIARKLKIEQDDLSLPYHSRVLIVERAVPASAPSTRQRRLGRTLLLMGLAIFGWGIVIVRKSKAGDSSASA